MLLADHLLGSLEHPNTGNPPQTKHCPLCSAFTGLSDSNKAIWDTVLLETENFLALPSRGSLIEGWILLFPKRHTLCIGNLTPTLFAELDDALKILSEAIYTVFSTKPTILEHGPARTNSTHGCGIDHAHLHLIPLPFQLSDDPIISALSWETIPNDLTHLSRLSEQKREYLLLWEPDKQARISTAADIPGQFFRRAIARKLGSPQAFDYRIHPLPEKARRTIELISSELNR